MKRPVKYKARIARRNRIILTTAVTVVLLSVIGAVTVGMVFGRRGENPPPPVDPVITDSHPLDTESKPDSSDTKPTVTETEPVTTGPVETKPIATEPVVTEPIATEPVETEPVETEPVETEPPQPEKDPLPDADYRGGYLDMTVHPTLEALQDAALSMKEFGYTAVMLDLKLQNGQLTYLSADKNAKDWGAVPESGVYALKDVCKIFRDAGLYVTGRVCAFRDALAVRGNRSAALKNETGFRFSDGASGWLSVYSADAQDYIIGLLSEMRQAGVDEVLLYDFGVPEKTKTDTPAVDEAITACDAVKAFLERIRESTKGMNLSVLVPAETVIAGKNEETGIDAAAFAGVLSDTLAVDLSVSALPKSLKIGGKPVGEADPAVVVYSLLAAMKDTKCVRPMLEATGDTATDRSMMKAVTAAGYAGYQMKNAMQ